MYRCEECGLEPTIAAAHLAYDPDWHLTEGSDGHRYHVSFDGKPCGPVLAVPARPKHPSEGEQT